MMTEADIQRIFADAAPMPVPTEAEITEQILAFPQMFPVLEPAEFILED